jgi:hypothetical protein
MPPDDPSAEIGFEDLAAGLRGYYRGGAAHQQAAVELLIWHKTWLRRPDFKGACITQRAAGLVARIDWEEAREFIELGYMQRGRSRPLPASTSERAVLDLAVALGDDQYRLSNMGAAHRRAIVQAVARAVGEEANQP